MANTSDSNNATSVVSYVVVAGIAFLAGTLVMYLGGGFNGPGADSEQASATAPSGAESGDNAEIPVGDAPTQGPEDALVTIVEYSDFECPFCKKGYKRIEKVKENFPDKVRVAFKHYPLPFHKNAKPAARAAMAAGEQGEEYFWKMHDKLFEKQGEWKKGDVQKIATKWAKNMKGLDAEKFKKALENNKSAYNERIQSEMQEGKELGVKGTPHFFINGEALSGAQPYDRFESVVKSKIKQAESMMESGDVDKSNVYQAAVAKNFEAPSKDKPKKKKKPKKGKRKQTKVEHVPVEEDDAVAGASAEEALVTVVEFSDFQCPFCDKVLSSVNKLKKNFGDNVRFVFKHKPLPMHQQAKPAARASIAAQKQGKFWEMHDLLFKNKDKIKNGGTDAIVDLAKELDLNVEQFKKDLESSAAKEAVKQDMELARKVGAGGTPNFWINGVNVVGAQPYSKFKQVIEQQIERAKSVKNDEGVSGEKLYKKVVEINKDKVGGNGGGNQPKKPKKKKKQPSEVDTGQLKIGNAPVKGPKDAPITIYEFSDFECPFCKRAHGTVKKVMENYEGKVKLVYKHFPLERMHDNAVPAAKATIAAQKQGKFWEMYDLMFQNQKKLGQNGIYEEWASQLGMNVEKFKKDMENIPKSRITEDKKMGSKVGIRGTPGFIINGKKLTGAQPYARFKSIIDKELGN